MTTPASNLTKYIFLMGASDDRTAKIAAADENRNIAYEWGGHNEFLPYLQVPQAEKETWPLLWFRPEKFRISQPKIIINCISNADIMTHALRHAEQVIADMQVRWGNVPVYNLPAGILRTTRDGIYSAFHKLPGMHIPRAVSCTPQNVRHLFELIEREKLNYPVIVRPSGTHGGRGMVLLNGPQDRELLDALAFDGGQFYVTEFVDFRGSDGLYTKSRFVWIDGAIYPRHSIAAEDWNVHASARGKAQGYGDLLKAEQERLENFETLINKEARRSVDDIARGLGLDYLGFDVCLRDDGSLLVFEINASQNVMAPSDYKDFPYMQPFGDRVIEAFNASIARRVESAKSRVA